MRAGRPAEEKPRRDDLGVVEDHQAAGREFVREIAEFALADDTVAIYEQFGGVTLRKRIFGNPLVRERIRKIFDMDLRNHSAKLLLFGELDKRDLCYHL